MPRKVLFKHINYKRLLRHHLKILKGLQYNSGLFAASKKNSANGYDKSWLRDNFYECLAFLVLKDDDVIKKTYKAILKIFLKHESKIDNAIAAKPKYRHRIHLMNFGKNGEISRMMQLAQYCLALASLKKER